MKLSKKAIDRVFYLSLIGFAISIPFIVQGKSIGWIIAGGWNAILVVAFGMIRKNYREK